MHSPPTPSAAEALPPGQTRALHVRAGAVLQVSRGRLWVTQSGDLGDHFLAAGDSLRLGHGLVVLQADTPHSAHYVWLDPAARGVHRSTAQAPGHPLAPQTRREAGGPRFKGWPLLAR